MTIVRGKCRAYSNEGLGIINANDLTIFVKGLFLDEDAEVEIAYANKKIAFARVVKLHSVSPDRIKMVCPVGTSCGGCTFQALSYDKEIEFKKEKILNAFKMFKLSLPSLDEFICATKLEGYRNKIQIPFGLNVFKKVTYGFYKSFSHDIVPISKCYIENDVANKIIQTIRDIMVEEIIAPYNEVRKTGIVRHVMIRSNHDLSKIMVVIITNKKDFKHRDFLFQKIQNRHPEVTSIIQNVNDRDTNVILGKDDYLIYGDEYIEDTLCGLIYRIHAKSFFQVNHEQCEKLYQKAISLLNLAGKETILDAYCGVGTIGLTMAKRVKKVVGIDITREAIDNAKMSARLNKITNVNFYAGDVKDIANTLEDNFDVVVVDPPRKGLSKEFKQFITTKLPLKLLYISCDPVTLARDISEIQEHYQIKNVVGVDMFPRTHHVETIALLELKTKD